MMNDTPDLRDTQNAFDQAPMLVASALELDPVNYVTDMDGFDLTDAQKVELLEALWNIMRRFVQMGIDVGTADPCGQVFGAADELTVFASDDVKSSFSKAMETRTDDKEENTA